MSNWLKLTVVALLGLLLYGGIYLYARHSDAFKFAEHVIKKSHNVEQRVGNIQRVDLSLFGNYKEKNVNGEKTVIMPLRVVGDKKTILINVKTIRKNGDWSIENASIEDIPIALE